MKSIISWSKPHEFRVLFRRLWTFMMPYFETQSSSGLFGIGGQEDDITVLTIEPIPLNEAFANEIDHSVSLAPA
jgi:hypothetical protein